jgi:hypothetical protein
MQAEGVVRHTQVAAWGAHMRALAEAEWRAAQRGEYRECVAGMALACRRGVMSSPRVALGNGGSGTVGEGPPGGTPMQALQPQGRQGSSASEAAALALGVFAMARWG